MKDSWVCNESYEDNNINLNQETLTITKQKHTHYTINQKPIKLAKVINKIFQTFIATENG